MKIGILTFHRAHNYGAALQCYALQETLRLLGYDVYVIDYRQPTLEYAYKYWNFLTILKSLKCPKLFFKYLRSLPKRKKGIRIFEEFSCFLKLTKRCDSTNIPQDFDAYIIGSDQLWVSKWTGGSLDSVYTGFFAHSKNSKIFSYAISVNRNTLDEYSDGKWEKIASNFCNISFREREMAELLCSRINLKIRTDIDPTLLLDKGIWDRLTNEKWKHTKYILTYHLPGRFDGMSEKEFIEKVKGIANQMHCDVVPLYPMQYTVTNFVSLFKYASGVITTSFHATVFSIIYKKPLMSIVLDDGFDNRYVNLLQSIGASDALVDKDLNGGVFPNLNYRDISVKLEKLRKESIDYLNSIKDIKQ